MNLPCKDYIERYYKIRTKKGNLVNLTFNQAQNELYEQIKKDYGKKPVRIIVLKARQLGISTFTESLITYFTTNQFNTDSIIVAHDSDSSASIYNMTKLMVDELPTILKPSQKYNNARLLSFDNDKGTGLKSSVRVGVANDSTRGQTYRYVHVSELAFWQHPDTAMLSLMQCVPNDPKTIVIVESTANGFNYFYDLWQKASNKQNDFIAIFFPWFFEKDYVKIYTGFELTKYELDIKAKYNLTNEQLEWRRWCIANNCNGDEERFRQEYPISPEEAFITSGNSTFNTQIILNRLKSIKPPIKVGYFKYDYDGLRITNIRWVDDEKGMINIYQEPSGDNTALGGDPAGDGLDYFTAHVLDRQGYQLATLRTQIDDDLYTKQIYCLGSYYNSKVSIETNFTTYVNNELLRLGYEDYYMRETYDQIGKNYQEKIGFRTTHISRENIIANLKEIFRESIHLINDRNTLNEALSMVRVNGKDQASEGTHDDLIMALAIAYECLNQLPSKKKEKKQQEYDSFFDYEG